MHHEQTKKGYLEGHLREIRDPAKGEEKRVFTFMSVKRVSSAKPAFLETYLEEEKIRLQVCLF